MSIIVTEQSMLPHRDKGGRKHNLRVKVGKGYPQEQPEIEADLPSNLIFTYNPVSILGQYFYHCEDTDWYQEGHVTM